jgi:hypothetical protein
MLLPFSIFWIDDHRHAFLSLQHMNDIIVKTRVPENSHRSLQGMNRLCCCHFVSFGLMIIFMHFFLCST